MSGESSEFDKPGPHDAPVSRDDSVDMSRRGFLRRGLAASGGAAAFLAALSPLTEMDPQDAPSVQQFLQKHYKEMDEQEMRAALQRIRKQVEHRYKVTPNVRDLKPMDGVEF